MAETLSITISALLLFIFGILELLISTILTHWIASIAIFILLIIISMLVNDVTALKSTTEKLQEKINDLNQLEDENYRKFIRSELENIIDEKFNYSLTSIYNENQMIGHEWTYKADDGHWVTSVFDEVKEKFIVKHFRTHQNTEEKTFEARVNDDMAHNKQYIYGDDRRIANVNGMEKHNGIYIPKK